MHHAQGVLRLRLQEVGRRDVSHLRFGPRPIQSRRTWSDDGSDSSPATSGASSSAPTCWSFAAHRAARYSSTPPTPPTRSGATPAPRGAGSRSSQKRAAAFGSSTPTSVAGQAGLGRRINTIMQTCFFAITDVLLDATRRSRVIKDAVEKTYGLQGRRRSSPGTSRSVDADRSRVCSEVETHPRRASTDHDRPPVVRRRRHPTSCSVSLRRCSPGTRVISLPT